MNENRKRKKTGRKPEPSDLASRPPKSAALEPPAGIVTLLTDFGLADTYVGVMKGVVASINPHARIIDLCHDVAPQDVRGAAFLLAGSFEYFPSGTIHVAVVDPTVGSDRRAICVQSGGHYFVGPDNGVVSIACYRAGRPKIFLLENESYFLSHRSRTFHGRDVFAPAAAHLSAGVPIEAMGRSIRSIERIRMPRPSVGRGPVLRGEVIYVDKFGNLVTSIGIDIIRRVFQRVDWSELVVVCADHEINGLSKTYSDARPGMALALIGSHDSMEIAVRNGSASSKLGAGRGDKVRIVKKAKARPNGITYPGR